MKNPTEIHRLAQDMRDKLGCNAGHVAHVQSEAAYLAGEFHRYKHWWNIAAAISELDGADQLSD